MPYRIKNNDKYNDYWMYVLLLSTIVILIQSLNNYEFTLYDVSISYSILLVPITFLCSNFIVKKFDYKKCIAAICISSVVSIIFSAVMAFAVGKTFTLSNFTGEFCAYVVSQFVNLTIYLFLLNNTKGSYVFILINYFFSILIYYLFFTLMYLDSVLIDNFIMRYVFTIIINFIMAIPIALIDMYFKRGND